MLSSISSKISIIILSFSFNINYVSAKNADFIRKENAEAVIAAPAMIECPSTTVISERYRCKIEGQWRDCERRRCCPGHILVMDFCIEESANICEQMRPCPQQCSVMMNQVVCTCFAGFVFNRTRHEQGEDACQDLDECQYQNGFCDHICKNELGSYTCECNEGFVLSKVDNQTCIEDDFEGGKAFYQGMKSVKYRLDKLEVQLATLNTAFMAVGITNNRLDSSKDDNDGEDIADDNEEEDEEEAELSPMLDTYKMVNTDSGRSFCRCRRGPVGPPGHRGPPGVQGERGARGEKGDKGDPGSFDFLMLIVADLRHDIEKLKNKVFEADEEVERFDLQQHLAMSKRLLWGRQWDADENNVVDAAVDQEHDDNME